MASYQSNVNFIADGEKVNAAVANRPLKTLQNNIAYIKEQLDNTSGASGKRLVTEQQAIISTAVVGSPVYWNAITSRFELAQAVDGKSAVIGIVRAKPYASSALADITLQGEDTINISSALEGAETLTAARYFLSSATAGKLTATRPASYQQSVLSADGSGKVWVAPQDKDIVGSQGAQGAQGAQGSQGVQGAQGAQGDTGGESAKIKTITAATYTVVAATDTVILCDASSNDITLTLPAAAGLTQRMFRFKKIDSSANTVTIDANASELIDGELSFSIDQKFTSVTIICNGTAWYIL